MPAAGVGRNVLSKQESRSRKAVKDCFASLNGRLGEGGRNDSSAALWSRANRRELTGDVACPGQGEACVLQAVGSHENVIRVEGRDREEIDSGSGKGLGNRCEDPHGG